MEWEHPGSPVKKKFKSQPSSRKVMLTIFWDSQGVILEYYLERGTTVNSVGYSEMLSTEMKPAIRTKRLLSSSVLLLHDNARPHTAIHTLQTLVKLGFTVLERPAYSPDLAPSDYHLFGPLKDALRGRRFTSDEGVKEAVHEWLAAQPKTFFSEGILKLLERWNKFIAKHGEYIEKCYNCKVYAVVEINYKNCVRILTDLPSYLCMGGVICWCGGCCPLSHDVHGMMGLCVLHSIINNHTINEC